MHYYPQQTLDWIRKDPLHTFAVATDDDLRHAVEYKPHVRDVILDRKVYQAKSLNCKAGLRLFGQGAVIGQSGSDAPLMVINGNHVGADSDIFVRDVRFRNIGKRTSTRRTDNIDAFAGKQGRPSRLVFQNCEFAFGRDETVSFKQCQDVVFIHCSFHHGLGPRHYGPRFYDCDRVSFYECAFVGFSYRNPHIRACRDVSLYGCTWVGCHNGVSLKPTYGYHELETSKSTHVNIVAPTWASGEKEPPAMLERVSLSHPGGDAWAYVSGANSDVPLLGEGVKYSALPMGDSFDVSYNRPAWEAYSRVLSMAGCSFSDPQGISQKVRDHIAAKKTRLIQEPGEL